MSVRSTEGSYLMAGTSGTVDLREIRYSRSASRSTSKGEAVAALGIDGTKLGDFKKREKWAAKTDFVLACLGGAVGLGNVWRFPYLCYKNGGGAFLIPYVCSVMMTAIPIILLEAALGQYTSQGSITAWAICPGFKGIGYATTVMAAISSIYYIIILAWTLLYLYFSFSNELPWATCKNEWNTAYCFSPSVTNEIRNDSFRHSSNVTPSVPPDYEVNKVDSTVEFWERRILNLSSGIEHIGTIQWELAFALLIVWLLCYLFIFKGIKISGKVVYFTAIFPYLMLTVLLIRGFTLPGAIDGIIFYIKPNWSHLTNSQVWLEAATQVLYSYAVAFGFVIAMSSYNDFNNDFYKQTLLVAACNSGTSIYAGFAIFSALGFMANELNTSVSEVAESGPGLAFIVYPKAISMMPFPPIWAILFFLMILFVGIDSQFVTIEGLVTAILDCCPGIVQKRFGRECFVGGVSLCSFLIGLVFVTNGGLYAFQLVDYYAVSGFAILWISFWECVAISWIYGANRFCDNIFEMIKYHISPWFRWCWLVITPAVLIGIFVFSAVTFQPLRYNRVYNYPPWAILIGWSLASISMLCIPGYLLYKFIKASGSLKQRWITVTTPKEIHLTPVPQIDLATIPTTAPS